MARLVRTLRVRRVTPCRERRGSDLVSFGRRRRAWSVRFTCGTAHHVSKLERYLQLVGGQCSRDCANTDLGSRSLEAGWLSACQ